jgi:hypothetical protein
MNEYEVIDDFIIEKGLVTAAFKEQEQIIPQPSGYAYTCSYTSYNIKLILRGLNNISHYLKYTDEIERDKAYKRIVDFLIKE